MKTPDVALARRVFEKGGAVACQIPLAERLDSNNPAEFDPVVERLFAFIVEGGE